MRFIPDITLKFSRFIAEANQLACKDNLTIRVDLSNRLYFMTQEQRIFLYTGETDQLYEEMKRGRKICFHYDTSPLRPITKITSFEHQALG